MRGENLNAGAIEGRQVIGFARGDDVAVDHDFGVFDSPDAFYARHGANLSGLKRWLFRNFVRHRMNRNVGRIRGGARLPSSPVADTIPQR